MNKILIIGLGLIGGSFAKALRHKNVAAEIWAFDTNIETINLAKKSGAINGFAVLDHGLKDFDLIVIATPLAFYQDILEKISEINPQNSTIIDLGSLKEPVLKKLPQNLQENFVACHPIAGSDKSGFENSSLDLFIDKKFVICKGKNTSEKSIKIVENLANKIAAKPDFIDAKVHDQIYALVSHLPQFLSFLTKEFSPKKQENDFIKTAFRLDNSAPELWEDIFKMNEKNLEKFYFEFFDNLTNFAKKIENNNYSELLLDLKNIVAFSNKNSEIPDFKGFAEQSSIIFRLFIVASYLQIDKIGGLQNYAGSGFKDFTSIISILKSDQTLLLQTLKTEQKNILSLIKKISS